MKISPEDHVSIHFYRYQAYRQLGDKVAYEMRIGDSNARAKARALAAVQANKTKKQLFWSSDWQRIQGLKGGGKGGRANTAAQWKARQKVGLKYGKSNGIKNQLPFLKSFLKYHVVWEDLDDNTFFKTQPAESLTSVIKQLESFKPGKIRNTTTFYKLIRGERKTMYNWKIVNKVIRSEAK
uniref:putative site-specific DNA endonuclease n=1 Tax=Massjukichlorella minus TaxID=2650457 RepID=UPI0024113732|nr:putative site-specific DNA endonuclease [Massjukichlorella minus]WDY12947.1 putative site-specific DNA endonuclease [Massjukichlorella minus]